MSYPNLYYEKKLWNLGFETVAGLDEVGRGSFAGPLVTACVAFLPNVQGRTLYVRNKVKIDDSKKLSPSQREISARWIKENALGWGIGVVTVAEINRIGLGKSTSSAFRRALKAAQNRLSTRIQYLLIDAFYTPYIRGYPIPNKKARRSLKLKDTKARQFAIVKGDQISLSISAASIIAKNYRDNLMIELAKDVNFKCYSWDKNKGYGTKYHLKALKEFGLTRHHRNKFVIKYLTN